MYAVHITEVRCVLQMCPPLFTVRNGKRSIMDGKGDEKDERTSPPVCIQSDGATSYIFFFFFFFILSYSFSTLITASVHL